MSGFVRFYLAWLVAVAGILISGSACGGGGGGSGDGGPTPAPTPAFGLTSELVTPAAQADALAFAPDGRLFFVEHWTGSVRIVTKDGKLLPDPVVHFDDAAADIALGLTGLALDPDFAANHYVYVYYTQLLAAGPPRRAKPVVVRFTEANNLASNMTTIVSDLPEVNEANAGNANGSLHFGPDGYLYLTLGDYDKPTETGPQGKELPEDLGTPIGKMLRLNKEDGSAAPDNPFATEAGADPRIFAYGFRNSFDFAFHPQTRRIYGSDNSGATCEELNIIAKGTNYGWPKAVESTASPSTSPQSPQVSTRPQGSDCRARQQFPAFYFLAKKKDMKPEDFGSSVGVRGMEFISGSVYPMLGDSLLVCEEGPQLIRRLVLGGPNFDQVTADDFVAGGCWLDITTSPDGLIYYTNLAEIRRLIPPSPTPSPESPSPSPQ